MDSLPQYQYLADVAKAVDGYRISAGLTVERLADTSKIPRGTLQRRLAALSPFTSKELYQLGAVFGVSPSQILLAAEQRGAA